MPQPLPTPPPELVRDRDASLAGVTAAEARRLLAEADVLRAGEPEERAAALAAYALLHEHIDAADPLGCERVRWALDALAKVDLRFVPLFRAASQRARRTVVRQRACVALGVHLLTEGDAAEAERLFLGVLHESRRHGSVPERAACLNLCRLYERQRRDFEGYLMARHAARLFARVDDDVRELYSIVVLLGLLGTMHEWDAFDAQLPRAEELVARIPANNPDLVPPEYAQWRMRALLLRGDPEGALSMLGALPPCRPAHAYTIHQPWWRALFRATVLVELGGLDEAAEILAGLHDEIAEDRGAWYELLEREAECAARRGVVERLRQNAERVLDRDAATLLEHLGTGRAIDLTTALARVLRDAGEDALARRAYDRAAQCAVERIREVERTVRELPELDFVDDEARETLARARRRAAGGHRELLAVLADMMSRAMGDRDPWIDTLRAGDHAVVCAWCARLRALDGRWMPLGHLLPDEGPLLVSHGVCDQCHDGAMAQAAGH